MARLRIEMPPALDSWIDQRLEQGSYVSRSEYICDLIRRDKVAATNANPSESSFSMMRNESSSPISTDDALALKKVAK